jgi:hypothetical protein
MANGKISARTGVAPPRARVNAHNRKQVPTRRLALSLISLFHARKARRPTPQMRERASAALPPLTRVRSSPGLPSTPSPPAAMRALSPRQAESQVWSNNWRQECRFLHSGAWTCIAHPIAKTASPRCGQDVRAPIRYRPLSLNIISAAAPTRPALSPRPASTTSTSRKEGRAVAAITAWMRACIRSKPCETPPPMITRSGL